MTQKEDKTTKELCAQILKSQRDDFLKHGNLKSSCTISQELGFKADCPAPRTWPSSCLLPSVLCWKVKG